MLTQSSKYSTFFICAVWVLQYTLLFFKYREQVKISLKEVGEDHFSNVNVALFTDVHVWLGRSGWKV